MKSKIFILSILLYILFAHHVEAASLASAFRYHKSINVYTNGNTSCTASGVPIACCTGSGTGSCPSTTANESYFPILIHINSSSFSSDELSEFFSSNSTCKRQQFFDSLESTRSGTHTGSNNASVLTDSTKSWTTNALIGMRISNITDGSKCSITANTSTTVTCTLSGGSEHDWDTNDSYVIDLSYEVEYCNNGVEALIWVAVPSIVYSSSNANLLYTCFGNDPNSADQDYASKVWNSSYISVWHFPDGTTLSGTDSTGNYNATNNSATATTLSIDGAAELSGSAQYFSTSNTNNYEPFSVETLVKADTGYGTFPACKIILVKWADNQDGWFLGVDSSGYAGCYYKKQNVVGSCPTGQYAVGTHDIRGVTSHVAFSKGYTTKLYLYLNGEIEASYTGTMCATNLNAETIGIGRYRGGDTGSYFDGKIDEVRISNTTRSASWMKLSAFSMIKTNFAGDNLIHWNITVDTYAPTVTVFSIPSSYASLTVPITTFTATDNVGVTGYCVNESSTPPTSSSCSGSGWSGSAQTQYVFDNYGEKTLYAWAKDADGLISPSYSVITTLSEPSVFMLIKEILIY
jgi:hypothetical protein